MNFMKSPAPEFVYKIFTNKQWEEAKRFGRMPVAPIDEADGYIHLSTAAQLAKTLELYFAGQNDVEILAISNQKVSTNLRWEPSRGGELFPHLYAALKMSDIEWQTNLSVAKDGKCQLPDKIV